MSTVLTFAAAKPPPPQAVFQETLTETGPTVRQNRKVNSYPFIARAPADVVEKEHRKAAELRSQEGLSF
jgi:hypothetical protein